MIPAEIISKPVPAYTRKLAPKGLKGKCFWKSCLKHLASCACCELFAGSDMVWMTPPYEPRSRSASNQP